MPICSERHPLRQNVRTARTCERPGHFLLTRPESGGARHEAIAAGAGLHRHTSARPRSVSVCACSGSLSGLEEAALRRAASSFIFRSSALRRSTSALSLVGVVGGSGAAALGGNAGSVPLPAARDSPHHHWVSDEARVPRPHHAPSPLHHRPPPSYGYNLLTSAKLTNWGRRGIRQQLRQASQLPRPQRLRLRRRR